MMKLIVNVCNLDKIKMADIIKKVKSFNCRIQIDLEIGQIIIEELKEEETQEIFKFINKYFSVLNIRIKNSVEEYQIEENSIANNNDDTILYKNKYIEEKLKSLIKSLDWAMYKKNVDEKELGRIILSASTLISMKYHGFGMINFSVGDIVDCCYGTNLTGEISGGHTHAIVCDINSNGMPYLIPISKENDKSKITSKEYIIFKAPNNAKYEDEKYTGGTIIIDKGKYLAPERIISVVGRVNEELLIHVLKKIPKIFTFYKDIEKVNKTKPKIKEKNSIFGEELSKIIGYAINKIDKSNSIEENVMNFLSEIEMNVEEKILIQAFIVSCYVEKVSYENITIEVSKVYPDKKRDEIKQTLKDNFKSWLEKYPELKTKCPNIAFIALLKLFAKHVK